MDFNNQLSSIQQLKHARSSVVSTWYIRRKLRCRLADVRCLLDKSESFMLSVNEVRYSRSVPFLRSDTLEGGPRASTRRTRPSNIGRYFRTTQDFWFRGEGQFRSSYGALTQYECCGDSGDVPSSQKIGASFGICRRWRPGTSSVAKQHGGTTALSAAHANGRSAPAQCQTFLPNTFRGLSGTARRRGEDGHKLRSDEAGTRVATRSSKQEHRDNVSRRNNSLKSRAMSRSVILLVLLFVSHNRSVFSFLLFNIMIVKPPLTLCKPSSDSSRSSAILYQRS